MVRADTESEQSAVTSSPFFQVVRRGYDCTQVDAYIPELVAGMAAAEHLNQEVEQDRVVLFAETAEVREYRDGLLEHLGRVHADMSTLLERTLKHKAQEAPAAEGTAEPKAHPSPRPPASRP